MAKDSSAKTFECRGNFSDTTNGGSRRIFDPPGHFPELQVTKSTSACSAVLCVTPVLLLIDTRSYSMCDTNSVNATAQSRTMRRPQWRQLIIMYTLVLTACCMSAALTASQMPSVLHLTKVETQRG